MGNLLPKKRFPKFLRWSSKSKSGASKDSLPDASSSTQSPSTTSPSPESTSRQDSLQDSPPPKSPRALDVPESPPAALPERRNRNGSVSSSGSVGEGERGIAAHVHRAAKAVTDGDVFLLFAGSGFSADSGLALHKELAEVPQYRSRSLSYAGLSDPCWLESDPSLFYGFWGTMFNDFRWTRPHEGYSIIASWKEKLFHGTAVSEAIKQRLRKSEPESNAGDSSEDPDPYQCREAEAGAFFVFTSSVNAHLFDFFDAVEVRECHGNVELWQCGNVCSKRLWRAPRDYMFRVDLRNMLASDPPGTNMASSADEVRVSAGKVQVKDERRVGKRRRDGARMKWLEHLPEIEESRAWREMFRRPNRPQCPFCNMPARPNVLMASDLGWIENSAQERRWSSWLRALKEESQGSQGAKRRTPQLNVVVMEIGAGLSTFPTVRSTSQSVAGRLEQAGACVTMVRINPSTPGPDGAAGARLQHFIDIPLRGVEALRMINAAVQATLLRRPAEAAV